jgi:hypothetical protein
LFARIKSCFAISNGANLKIYAFTTDLKKGSFLLFPQQDMVSLPHLYAKVNLYYNNVSFYLVIGFFRCALKIKGFLLGDRPATQYNENPFC